MTNATEPRHVIKLALSERGQAFYNRFWFVADLLTAVVVVLFWSVILYGGFRYFGIVHQIESTVMWRLSGVVSILVVGILAFAIRLWARRVYGIAEVLFALVVTWTTLKSTDHLNSFQFVIAMVSAVYLVVRGLDNWLQGRRSHC